jgi:hypothetical protein
MTTCNAISNNPLLSNYFQFTLDRVPNMVYFCQSANIPGIAYGVAEQPTTMGYPVQVPTGAIRFEDLLLTFRVDENLTNWKEIHDWIRTTSNYENDASTLEYSQKASSATLTVTNSSYKPKIAVRFKQIFPKYLSSINFSITEKQSTEVLASVQFAFTGYTIETLDTP